MNFYAAFVIMCLKCHRSFDICEVSVLSSSMPNSVSINGVSLQIAMFRYILRIVLIFAEVMNISEGTVVAAPKVGRPRKAVVIAPGGSAAIPEESIIFVIFVAEY